MVLWIRAHATVGNISGSRNKTSETAVREGSL